MIDASRFRTPDFQRVHRCPTDRVASASGANSRIRRTTMRRGIRNAKLPIAHRCPPGFRDL